MYVNSRLKVTKIKGQRKAFYRYRSPESSYARRETVDIDILVTSRNGDRKMMQSIRIMSRPPLTSLPFIQTMKAKDLFKFKCVCHTSMKKEKNALFWLVTVPSGLISDKNIPEQFGIVLIKSPRRKQILTRLFYYKIPHFVWRN